MNARRTLSGWGRWPQSDCALETPASPDAAARLAATGAPGGMIARGLGRAYGDTALSPACTLSSARLNRMLAFDEGTGALTAESGVSLGEIITAFLPRGFFPAVTPGTKFITLGGAIAADVHGKNHHGAGSFGEHVAWFDLAGADGAVRRCSPHENADLFNATLGGMGLTGVVLRAAITLMRVESGWIRNRTLRAPDLDAAIAAFEGNMDAPYSVAWIDSLARGAARGRAIVHLGAHARLADLPPDAARAPFAAPARRRHAAPPGVPSFALNRTAARAFNAAYWRAGARLPAEALVDWDRYFYPLDALAGWNRLYGARGFAQHQCALPLATARDALAALLDSIARAGAGSFLSVLKRFGPGAPARPLSFAIEGYTLAVDLPISPEALALMTRMDAIVSEAGGRIYLAKDARMTRTTLRAGYGGALDAFARMAEREAGGAPRFASVQSQRLGL
jgi:FAD/FMN-containing dehydrogenase